MTETFTWSLDGDRLSLAGRIDENADLAALAAQIPPSGARVDLRGITRINSIGVREWMDFVSAVADRPLRLERCAPVFVDQLNAIANFAGVAKVDSVMAAFECERDGDVEHVEVRVADLRAGKAPAPPPCPRCREAMTPTQESELYYRFLRYL